MHMGTGVSLRAGDPYLLPAQVMLTEPKFLAKVGTNSTVVMLSEPIQALRFVWPAYETRHVGRGAGAPFAACCSNDQMPAAKQAPVPPGLGFALAM